MLPKQLQVNRSGRQRHAAWGMSQHSDKWSVHYEMGLNVCLFVFFFKFPLLENCLHRDRLCHFKCMSTVQFQLQTPIWLRGHLRRSMLNEFVTLPLFHFSTSSAL